VREPVGGVCSVAYSVLLECVVSEVRLCMYIVNCMCFYSTAKLWDFCENVSMKEWFLRISAMYRLNKFMIHKKLAQLRI